MKLINTRFAFTHNSTIGKLTVDNQILCYILEPTDRGLEDSMALEDIQKRKIWGKTAIPTGTYELKLISGAGIFNRFHFLADKYTVTGETGKIPFEIPELQNVKDFSDVLIHPGNYPKDTEGCSLVGGTIETDFVGATPAAFEALRVHCFDAIRAGGVTYTLQRDLTEYQKFLNSEV